MIDKLLARFSKPEALTELAQEVSNLEKWIEKTRELEKSMDDFW